MTRHDPLAAAVETLAAAGITTPRADAEWLLAGVLGGGRVDARLAAGTPLGPDVARRFADAVRRRAAREPLQHILGWEGFRGLRFTVTPDVLVPRPETETLVEVALGRLPAPGARRLLALDAGTGSGCIACALAYERPDLDVVASDVSERAADVARANARALGLDARVRVLVADGLPALGRGAALIVANLPYVPTAMLAALDPEVARHDPRVALDGGPDGLAVIRPFIGAAGRALAVGGALALETDGGDQARAVAQLMRAAAFDDVELHRDLPGLERFVTGRRAA
ncbi:MAG: peptide chain release factor N(5)-glutamine methyltransferase [Candidatus Rokubacteria bacterium]|nr:peptide chain release factor N(5)-glutamine methyltransferase [Candidatus Rokubacteria bacterium]